MCKISLWWNYSLVIKNIEACNAIVFVFHEIIFEVAEGSLRCPGGKLGGAHFFLNFPDI